MSIAKEKDTRRLAEAFVEMHSKGKPLVLANVWDPWTAVECQAAGHKALATSSYAVAESLGYKDGENIPLQSVLTVVKDISRTVSVPLSVDFEAGFGDTSQQIENSITLVIDAGAVVGINLEDGLTHGKRVLANAEDHCERIARARAAADACGVPLFINARFDGVLLGKKQTEVHIDDAIRRAALYQEAGANGLFVPGLTQLPLIQRLSSSIDLPLNIMMTHPGPSLAELTSSGVSRISLGGWPFEFMRRRFRKAVNDFALNPSTFFSDL